MSRLVTASLVVAFLLLGCSETEEEKQAMRKKVLVFTKFMKSAEEARFKRRFPGGGFKGNPGGGFNDGLHHQLAEPEKFEPVDAVSKKTLESTKPEKLIPLLKHKNPAVRDEVATRLHFVKTATTIDALLAQLKIERSPKVRANLADALAWSSSSLLREHNKGDPNSDRLDRMIDAFIAALDDGDSRVARAAVSGLGRIKKRARRAGDAVIKALESKSGAVRAAAADAFYQIEPANGRKALSSLRQIVVNDSDLFGAHNAGKSLGRLGDTDFLLQMATGKTERAAIRGLGEVNPTTDRIIKALTNLAKTSFNNSSVAVDSLATAHPTPESLVDVLAGFLEDSDNEVREAAARAFGKLDPKHKKAVPILLANLKHKQPRVRAAILASLAEYDVAASSRLAVVLPNVLAVDSIARRDAERSLRKDFKKLLPDLEKLVFDSKAKAELRSAAIVAIAANRYTKSSSAPNRYKELVRDKETPLAVRAWAAIHLPYQDRNLAEKAEVFRQILKEKSHERLVSVVLQSYRGEKKDPKAHDLIIAALEDHRENGEVFNSTVSAEAAAALAAYDNPKSAAALIAVAAKPGHKARPQAILALGAQVHSAKNAYGALLARLGESDRMVLETAAVAIKGLSSNIQEWQEDNPTETLPGGKVDFTSCVTPIRKLLGGKDRYLLHPLVSALRVAGPAAAEALPELQKLASDSLLQQAIAEVAGEIGPKAEPLVPKLLVFSAGEDEYTAAAAIRALGNIGKPLDVIRPKLIALLATEKQHEAAADALISLGAPAISERKKIAGVLAHAKSINRLHAARALASMGAKAKDTAPKIAAAMTSAKTGPELNWLAQALINVNGPTDKLTIDAMTVALGHKEAEFIIPDHLREHIQLASAVLSRALQSATPEVQTSALELIEEFRDKKGFSLDSAAIKQALNSKNEKVRAAAAALLANSGDEPQLVIPIVVASIGKVEEDDLWRTQRPITRIGRPAVPALIAAIANPKNTLEHRRRLMLVLKDMGSYAHRAQPELRKIVAQEKDATLKHLAAIILAQLTGDSKYVDLLLAAMETKGDDRKSSRMRRDAARAMRNIKLPAKAIDALIAKLETDESDYSHTSALRDQTFSRAHIAKLLAGWEKSETGRKKINVLAGMENKPKEVIEALLKAIRSEHEDVASNAASALSSQPGITDAVFEIIGDEKATAETRKAALAALDYDFKPGKKHDAKLLPLLKHKDRDLAARAARLLVRAKRFPDSEIPGLVDSLLDSRARYRARSLLVELGEKVKPQLPQLHKLFAGEDDRVSNAALQVLSKLEEPAKLVPKVVARMKTKTDRYERESLALYLSYGGKSGAPEILKHVASEKDASIRIALLKSLEEQSAMPTDSADAVAKLVADKDMLVSTYAAMLMTHLDTESRKTHAKTMIEKLASALIAKDAEGAKLKIPRYGVGMALFRMGTLAAPAVPVLTKALDNKEQRSSALAALGRIGEPAKSAIPKMLELLAGKDASYEVVNALNSFDKKTLEPHKAKLVAALTSLLRKNKVVSSSVLLLGKLDASGDAAKTLSELLKDGFYDVEAVRGMANLGAHAGKEVTDRVLAIVGSEDSPVDLRGEAIAALPSLGLRQAASADLLKIVAGDEPYLLRMAARGLGTGRDAKTVVPALTKLLAHKDDNVRSAALYSLSSFGKEAAPATKQVVTLIANRRTRYPAFRCLESIGPAAVDAVPGLTKALGDPAYRHYREQIVRSLRAIGKAAKPAVPELLKLVDPTNTGKPGDFEESVIEAIYEIDAEAAKKAGLPDPKSKK